MKHIYINLVILSVLAVSCSTPKSNSDKSMITVSIAPQKYFIERLTGDLIEVNVMIPQGSNHATYSPTAGQIKKLAQSDAYIQMGHLSFEATWADKLQSANSKMKWYDLSKGINMIQGEHHHHHGHDHVCTGGIDPHTWTSPIEAQVIAKNLKVYLSELYPQHKEQITSNYEKLTNDLNGLDEQLRKLQSENERLTFMIFHPAYTYLARAYGFEQMSIEFEGKTPTPARLKATIVKAREKAIKTIYIQEEFDRTNAEVIAKEIGAETVQVNPLSENWMHEMKQFIKHLENN